MTVHIQQQVGWLDVAVNNPMVMGMFKGIACSARKPDNAFEVVDPVVGILRRQRVHECRVNRLGAMLLRPLVPLRHLGWGPRRDLLRVGLHFSDFSEDRGQTITLDILHSVMVHTTVAADRIEWNDVRVVQCGGCLGFDPKTFQLTRIQKCCKGHYLQCHAPAECDLFGFVDNPHPAPTDFADQSEFAETPEIAIWSGKDRLDGRRNRVCDAQFGRGLHRGQNLL